MRILMIKGTAFKGYKVAGKEYGPEDGITDEIATRWINKGIAAPVVDEKEPDYATMKPKQLYELCIEKGIEVEAKKDKDYYIKALNGEGSEPDPDGEGKPADDDTGKPQE